MTLESNDAAAAAGKGSPFDGVGGSFLDVLVLFLRTIPLYPDGHGRVVAVTEKFQGALAQRGSATVVEPTEGGLRVDGEDQATLSTGAAAFRGALVRTGVSRVTFQADAPHSSYVVFARSLQRNARLAQSGHLTFGDLWMAPLEGIKIEEQSFSRDDFTGAETEGDAVIGGRGGHVSGGDDDDGDRAGGGGGSGRGGGRGEGIGHGDGPDRGTADVAQGAGEGSGSGAGADAPGPGTGSGSGGDGTVEVTATPLAAPAAKAAPRHGRALRRMVLDDPAAAELLAQVRELLAARGEVVEGEAARGQDVLDHLLASLPIEARLDLRRGVSLVRDVLKRLASTLDPHASRETPELSGALLRAMEMVFPDRAGELRTPAPPPPPAPAPTAVAASVSPEDEAAAELAAIDDLSWATSGALAHLPVVEFDDFHGVSDEAAALTHALLVAPEGPRVEVLRGRLSTALHDRSPLASPACVVDHLKTLLAEAPERRDTAKVRALAGALEASRIDIGKMLGTGLDPDLVVSAFPSLVGPFVAAGGTAGYLARKLGRSAVLAAGPELHGPDGLLARDDLVQRVLDERTRDVLPFVEQLLPARDPARRRAVLSSLRRTDLPSVAAVALRVAPENGLSDDLVHVLCEDGFDGKDSHRADEEAVAAIGLVAQGRTPGADAVARAYATSVLAAFNPALAGPIVRALARRRFFVFGAPKEVRGAAALVLDRWERGEGRESFGLARAEEDRR